MNINKQKNKQKNKYKTNKRNKLLRGWDEARGKDIIRKISHLQDNELSNIMINRTPYSIMLYETLPEEIINETKDLCENMYEGYSNEDTRELTESFLSSGDKKIYILKNVILNKIVSFIAIKDVCEDSCFNCSISCSYILLTCVGKNYRGKGIFKHFFQGIENYLRENYVNCIRLTAVNRKVFELYLNLGFRPENQGNAICQYKMIKYI